MDMRFEITEKCRFCDTCISVCPADAIKKSYPIYRIDQQQCQKCGHCVAVCANHAITKLPD
ncbi:MAG: 4Fe-4S binding protein [Bacillota bacterium]|nr:4Fe-4S binding protein [Bacillota bacterium]MDW7682684.1 4Fe-4S binding protein [Bacillota bacterium]